MKWNQLFLNRKKLAFSSLPTFLLAVSVDFKFYFPLETFLSENITASFSIFSSFSFLYGFLLIAIQLLSFLINFLIESFK